MVSAVARVDDGQSTDVALPSVSPLEEKAKPFVLPAAEIFKEVRNMKYDL